VHRTTLEGKRSEGGGEKEFTGRDYFKAFLKRLARRLARKKVQIFFREKKIVFNRRNGVGEKKRDISVRRSVTFPMQNATDDDMKSLVDSTNIEEGGG